MGNAMSDEKILDRVRKLLAIAEHPNTPPAEAEVALRQANSLIAKHAIEEAILRAAQTEGERRAPVQRRIQVAEGITAWNEQLRTILYFVATTNRCEAVLFNNSVQVYGMADDVSWVEMLYTTIHFEFLNKLSPKWNDSLGYDHNIYNFKVAGEKWERINEIAVANGAVDQREWKETPLYFLSSLWQERLELGEARNYDADRGMIEVPTGKIKGAILSAYKRHAKKVGDKAHVTTSGHRNYKRQFAEAFQNRIVTRLLDMQEEAKKDADTIPGAALALVSSEEAVRQAMWADFPSLSPEAQAERRRAAQEEYDRWWESLNPAQQAKEQEKIERERRRRSKEDDRRWKERERQYNDSAHRLGRAAADGVQLSRHAGHADAAESRKQIG